MARAMVTVKEGKTYRWGAYTFTSTPSYVTDAGDIAALKNIGVLNVVEDQDAPPPPKPAAKKAAAKPPAPEGETETTSPAPVDTKPPKGGPKAKKE